jgi:AmmeMemoRadiSam system protein A
LSEHPLVQLARATIEKYIRDGIVIEPPAELIPEMKEKAGVFVSLHEKGQLRGCIGTFAPTTPNVASEIIHNAIASATEDPRFPPVEADELSELEISIDVLSPPEAISSKEQLDVKCYGCIVKAGGRRGLLLPDLEGVDSADQQIAICKRKAGIGESEKVDLFRFKVKRYH